MSGMAQAFLNEPLAQGHFLLGNSAMPDDFSHHLLCVCLRLQTSGILAVASVRGRACTRSHTHA